MGKRRILVLVALTVSVGVSVGTLIDHERTTYMTTALNASPTTPDTLTASAAKSIQAPQAGSKKLGNLTPNKKAISEAAAWELFKDKFGDDLQVHFFGEGENRRVAEILSPTSTAKKAKSNFNPEDPQQSIQRAKEVLDAARELLGLSEELPLEQPTAEVDPDTIHVHFQETVDGVPLMPRGTITMDLGSQGEVLGIYSQYVRGVKIVNSRQLGTDQAKALASLVLLDQKAGMRVEGGRAIVWAKGVDGEVEGRHAFEFNVQGRQVIIDAQTGKVLYSRDHRHF